MKIKPHRVKTILYEPIAPYFNNAYNTIISIVQGIALSSLFFIINNQYENNNIFNKFCIFKVIIIFLTICIIWHRYITHNQYLVWRIDVLDTIIPMLLAVSQILLALSVDAEIFYFSLIFTVLCFLGSVAYINAIFKYNRPMSLELYKEHFYNEGEEFAQDLLQAVKKYEKKALYICIGTTVIFAGITLFIFYRSYSEEVYSLITCSVCLIILLLQLFFNLERELKLSDELKEFFE